MLFDLVSAPKITRAARFCSLRILSKLSALKFSQTSQPPPLPAMLGTPQQELNILYEFGG